MRAWFAVSLRKRSRLKTSAEFVPLRCRRNLLRRKPARPKRRSRPGYCLLRTGLERDALGFRQIGRENRTVSLLPNRE